MSSTFHVSLASAETAVLLAPRFRDLAKLESVLRLAGCEIEARYDPPRLCIALGQLAAQVPALAGWEWTADADAQSALDQGVHQRRRFHEARCRVAELSNSLQLASEAIAGLVPEGLLDPHQVIAVAAASDPLVDGLCLFDEQGLGKTLEGIAGFHTMSQRGIVRRALVFAPKNMLTEWERDLERFFPGQYQVRLVAGTQKQRRAAIHSDADVYVANFETAVSEEASLRSLLKMRPGGSVLVVDESFHVKNPDAVRTSAIRRLRSAANRCLVLCGTPAPNSPKDIVEQFNIADGGNTFASVRIPDDPEAAKLTIAAAIESRGVYLRRLKVDVLPDLPGKTFHRTLVPLTKAQRALYAELLHGYANDLEATSDAKFRAESLNFLARRAKLLRVCTDPGGADGQFNDVPAKRMVIDSLLSDLIDRQGEKVVLWTSYTNAIDEIIRRYSSYNPVRIDGTVSEISVRRDAITRFQNDDATMLFVGNPAAAGAGITLHRARVAIYESLPTQTAAYFQSLDRIHRRGQSRAVDYIVLLGAGTLEVGEFERLTGKARRSRELLGDREPNEITREALLEEANAALNALETAL